jgi:hypothetical protein
MKTCIFFLALSFALFSCEKETGNKPVDNEGFVPGMLSVGFAKNARLKSAFDLMNKYHLRIVRVYGILYVSKLPADSIDYVVDMLKIKPYLYSDRTHIHKDGDVYLDVNTGKITVIYLTNVMDEISQTDWFITAGLLKLEEQPSLKSFLLEVPFGEEIYWRDKLKHDYIVSRAELVGTFYDN